LLHASGSKRTVDRSASDTLDEGNPANQLRLVVYLIIYRVFYIPGGAGFLPSTVFRISLDKFHLEGITANGGEKDQGIPQKNAWKIQVYQMDLPIVSSKQVQTIT